MDNENLVAIRYAVADAVEDETIHPFELLATLFTCISVIGEALGVTGEELGAVMRDGHNWAVENEPLVGTDADA